LWRQIEVSVLFTRRTDNLAHHAGQVSFPGGSVEAGDGSYTDTALRELHEEVGIARTQVAVVGTLDTLWTRSGFQIVPVVGLVTAPFTLQLHAKEVAEVFEVPLTHLLDEVHFRRREMDDSGLPRVVYAIDYGPHTIWGATAAMLVDLRHRISNALPELCKSQCSTM
jgi:8-oxo-dGTP pyrophosphatase MutT (NUDIX family)